jgi:hypothetical protein
MFPEIVGETIGLMIMFILRVGVPIAITYAAGRWLEKRLAPPETSEEKQTPARQAPSYTRSGKIIRVHCWDIKHCDQTQRAECAAFKHPDLPCWLALQAEGGKIHEQCFTCAFYKPTRIAA